VRLNQMTEKLFRNVWNVKLKIYNILLPPLLSVGVQIKMLIKSVLTRDVKFDFFNIRSLFETIRIPFEVRIWAWYCTVLHCMGFTRFNCTSVIRTQ